MKMKKSPAEDIAIAAVTAVFIAILLIVGLPRHFTGASEYAPVSTVTGGGIISADDGTVIIDINKADAGLLMCLPGIGEKTAAAIIAEREKNGPFTSVDDLVRVNGIGEKTVEAVRALAGVK